VIFPLSGFFAKLKSRSQLPDQLEGRTEGEPPQLRGFVGERSIQSASVSQEGYYSVSSLVFPGMIFDSLFWQKFIVYFDIVFSLL